MKKLKVFCVPDTVTIEGENLQVKLIGNDVHPILNINDGDKNIAMFQRWEYWVEDKEE